MHKLVVDSSIWIDFFNKKASFKTEHLKSLLTESPAALPIIILPVIMQEVLQGIVDEKFFNKIERNLEGLEFIYYEGYEFAIKAARLYSTLRKKGVTIYKANDCLIAALCIEHDVPLFHNDRDFDNIAKHTLLNIYNPNK